MPPMTVKHSWHVSPSRAVEIQRQLAERVSVEPSSASFRLVAGGDAAFTRDATHCLAAVVVWDAATKAVVETRWAIRPVRFPYIPGLLSFREAPALLAAFRKLRRQPDAVLCDGQGRAHPRRCGLASHLGLLLNIPTAGCGKSRLIGTHTPPARRRGSRTPLIDRDETVGMVLRTRTGVQPVYVSIGHRLSLEQAVELVLACGNGLRLPEPTRLADQLAARIKRGDTPNLA